MILRLTDSNLLEFVRYTYFVIIIVIVMKYRMIDVCIVSTS